MNKKNSVKQKSFWKNFEIQVLNRNRFQFINYDLRKSLESLWALESCLTQKFWDSFECSQIRPTKLITVFHTMESIATHRASNLPDTHSTRRQDHFPTQTIRCKINIKLSNYHWAFYLDSRFWSARISKIRIPNIRESVQKLKMTAVRATSRSWRKFSRKP